MTQRMPFVTAFYRALGTGMVISVDSPIDDKVRSAMESLIEDYEHVLSRFRNDSLIAALGKAEHGGSFDFPDWCAPLFDLYDALFSATSGAIDPCVGEDLIRLGYDASLSLTVTRDAPEHLGALRGRAVWGRDVTRHGTTLVTHEPVQLDFGACGKGYLVDLLGRMLQSSQFVIDAGGDLLIHAEQPISVALEDPEDQSHAIGIAHIANGALCASAPSRRHWNMAVNERTQIAIHHLLNAIDGLPGATNRSQLGIRSSKRNAQSCTRLPHRRCGRPGHGPVRFRRSTTATHVRFHIRNIGRIPPNRSQPQLPGRTLPAIRITAEYQPK